MNALAAQRLLRERRRKQLTALRVRRAAASRGQGLVLRINEPPLPETMAYLRELYGPNVAVVVDPTAVNS